MSKPLYDLRPIIPGESYKVIEGDGGNISDLPYIPVDNKGFYSVWYCDSFWQRLLFLFTGKIGFFCLAEKHPPIALVIHRNVKNG